MEPYEIDNVLNTAEVQIAAGGAPVLKGTGFWPAVAAVKRDPELADRFADRIGAIDKAAFDAWARIVVPIWIGTALAVAGVLIGLAMIVTSLVGTQWKGALFLAGTAILLGTTHGLGHLVVGLIGGIRFSAWFIGPGRPQPGVKTDYSSYVRATARARAWMHAAGAIVTKSIPFLLLPIAILTPDMPTWVALVLLAVGVLQILTDALWSVKSSDWAKFRREMQSAS